MHPLRVAFVLHVMQVAGAEVLVAETIRRLGPRIDPVIFCLDAVGQLGEQLQGEGVPVLSFGRRPGRDWRVVRRMRRELRQRRIQIIHAHQYTPFFYSALANVAAGRPARVIFTEHGRHYPDVVGRGRRLANRWVLSAIADEVNAVCEFSARALRTLDGFSAVPVNVVENGIDASAYQRPTDLAAARAHVGLDPGRRYVSIIARFHPVKDHATLIEAFATVAAMRPDVDLLLIGDGPLRPNLEEQIRRLSLGDRVKLMGIRRDVPAILAATSVFCLPSVSEAASLTLMEALAAAVPVVVTDVGGNPEIVREGIEGLLVPRSSPGPLGTALLAVLDDPEFATRAGTAGAVRARELYNIERTANRYGELYQRLATT